ncbi:peptidoglycan editing factor PgeF [Bowmanella dokdonensis]|uniref:Purine nucleoside phosphorylase n=1 Tax=Bowmanella dokdonensis TaxID=751969 RepID=A0A939DQI0_9ALTE|nr:peptidoglycan editing factor PgeF [Bowmanella dokdonensis]MBN7827119.1 peptidoglycan editing factor PgeF [Bowmanella dokdonensis]
MTRAGTEHFIYPDWPAPKSVQAFCSTRQGGRSQAPFDSFNMGLHVGDDPQHVQDNRQQLPEHQQIVWLSQVHGNRVVRLTRGSEQDQQADAAFSVMPGVTCAVMTADCLPVLFCHKFGHAVAAAHAGWRGLAAGVLENTLKNLPGGAGDYLAWLGPAISAKSFVVGEDVKSAFPAQQKAFKLHPQMSHKYLADIYQIARHKLQVAGLQEIYGGGFCTYTDKERFYSYRRDGQTGRMVSAIWLTEL